MRHGLILRALASTNTHTRRFLSSDSKAAVALTLTPREKEEDVSFAEYVKQVEAVRRAAEAKQKPVENPAEKQVETSSVKCRQ